MNSLPIGNRSNQAQHAPLRTSSSSLANHQSVSSEGILARVVSVARRLFSSLFQFFHRDRNQPLTLEPATLTPPSNFTPNDEIVAGGFVVPEEWALSYLFQRQTILSPADLSSPDTASRQAG